MSTTEHQAKQAASRTQRGEDFAQVLERRISRRTFIKGSAITTAGVAATSALGQAAIANAAPLKRPAGFTAIEQPPITSDEIIVPDGYTAEVLIRWGDPILEGAPEFDYENQTVAAQEQQFGYNNDMLAFFPLPQGEESSDNGILVVNHEYPNVDLMFPDYDFEAPTEEQINIGIACQGMSMVEIERGADGKWSIVPDSQYNRRITSATEMDITGPAAGHDLMKTSADSTGTKVAGTLNNCAGGWTPWGTYLGAEENFHQYFANAADVTDEKVKEIHARYGVPEETSELKWETVHDRYDVSKEPNEPFRHGWLVEVDPYNPTSVAKKRTALGRFRHEAGTTVVAPDGRLVCYTGDDARFEYMYKFVTEGTYDPGNREANMDLLDAGTLYVARFNDDGTGEWLPMVFGEGPLTEDNGFESQADLLINTRTAGDELGATPMDRPEDAEVNPMNNKLYIMLTNNTKREAGDTNAANPRPENTYGHVIELTEDGDDFAATEFTWEILLLCGPTDDDSTDYAGYDKTKVSPISCPDNCTFDNQGNLWIATDGQPKTIDTSDALHMVPVEGAERGHAQQFLANVAGAETCGPLFTPDNTTLFIAVQHPGEGGTPDEPVSVWPDGQFPPRPSVVAIQANDGSPIGGAGGDTAEATDDETLPASGLGLQTPGVWVAAAGLAAAGVGAFLRRRSALQNGGDSE
jgi:uncharacterized protein